MTPSLRNMTDEKQTRPRSPAIRPLKKAKQLSIVKGYKTCFQPGKKEALFAMFTSTRRGEGQHRPFTSPQFLADDILTQIMTVKKRNNMAAALT